MAERITTKDILRMALAVIFGRGVFGFLEAAGFLNQLAENLGGSTAAAYLVLMFVTGIVLVVKW